MNEIKMDREFQTLFPTVSRDEYINIMKEISGMNFRNKDELYKWIILKEIGRDDLSLYIKGLYAIKYKELVEKYENKFIKSGMKPYVLSNVALSRMTNFSRDAIDKIIVINREADQDQHNRLFNDKASLNKVYYELRPEQKKKPKEKIPETHKTCKDCGMIKPISKFYKGRGICKVCYNEKDYGANIYKDVKGNTLEQDESVTNLTRKYSDEIENDLYDVDKHIEYTIEDMEDEINALLNYFERNVNNCIGMHKTLVNKSSNSQRIIDILDNANEKIKNMKGMLSHGKI